MKQKLHYPKTNDPREIHPVNYRWTGGDGITCHGHSVCDGKSKAQAERRFFKQNPHVQPDEP